MYCTTRFERWIKVGSWLKIVGLAMLFSLVTGVSEGAVVFRVTQKEEAYIGCEVVLSLDGAETEKPDVTYEWSFEGNARPILLRRGGLECRFTPVDTDPIKASISAFDPDGNFLSSTEISVQPKEFMVEIVMIEPEPFILWDANAKRDIIADGLIAGEPVQFTVKLIPEYNKAIRCHWNVDASTAIRSGEEDIQVTIARNEIGDAELSVVVMDQKSLFLGRGSRNVNVPIPRTRVEESQRRKKAWLQWSSALTQWDAKNFDEAIGNAISAAETDPETIEITDGLKTMSANYARVERSRKLTVDAAALQSEQKLVEALKTYRRAYAAWALTETETVIKNLEVEIDKIRVRRQQAEWLKDIGAAYDQEGFFADALIYYRETMELQPDDAVAQRAERIERRLASIATANALADEGRNLESGGKLQEAVDKYKESLKVETNTELDTHTKELENAIKERKALATTLRREAADLQRRNNNADALLRYRESQALWPDAESEKRIAELEKSVTGSTQQAVRTPEAFGIGTQADAARLLQEGHALYKQGKYKESLDIYRKSYAISKDQRLADWITRVETSLKEYEAVLQANVLIKEANSFYDEGKYAEALQKYKESLSIHSNTEVENFIGLIETNLKSADVAPASGN